jgi:hypothetical protein
MKNTLKWLGIIALMALIVCTMVTCDNGSTSSGNAPSTKGVLTITGLESYNGNYIFGQGGTENVTLIAAENVNWTKPTVTGGRISNGSVTLKVWRAVETDELVAYSGNNQDVAFYIFIYSKATVSVEDDDALAAGYALGIDFNSGAGSGQITNITPIIPSFDIGNGIKARIEAYHYGPDSSNTEESEIHLDFTRHSVRIDGSGYDYKQDFEVKLNGQIFPFDYSPSISGGSIDFDSYDSTLITAGEEYRIQIKYTANPNRKIKIWIPKGDDDHWEPSGSFDILNSFDTGVKTVTASQW